MANLFFFLTLMIIPNHRLFSAAAQPPAPAPTSVAGPIFSSIPTPSPPPIITVTFPPPPPPPPPLSPPPTTTINSRTPPPQPIQLNDIIDALIGAGDFAGWANILSNTSNSNLPLSATFFIPGNDALSHLPTSTASGSVNFDPLIIAYHIIPQRFSFSDLLLFKSETRLPTLLPTKSILITNNSPAYFSVDNSPITHPDMYTNSDVSVHGIGKILDYSAYGGNPFQPPLQQTLNPSTEVANNRRSDSATLLVDYQLFFSIMCAVLAFNIEMRKFNKTKIGITLVLCGLCFFATAHGMSVNCLDGSCLNAYLKGGSPGVLLSSKCAHCVGLVNSYKSLQGHQEHRMSCNLDLKMPLAGTNGYFAAKLDLIAIFYFNEWVEASEMANQKLLDYFIIYILFDVIKEEEVTECQHYLNSTRQNQIQKCDLATHQGHRQYQEGRMTCNLDLKLPVLGRDGDEKAKLAVLAIFDGHGHGAAEASEMANQKLLDYFILHILFHIPKQAVLTLDHNDLARIKTNFSRSVVFLFESSNNTLKEALLKAIHDIDMDFWLEAYEKGYFGGSTATVVLVLNDEEILVASLGDSPALLCKGSHWSRKLRAENLTRSHYPGEADERVRIESAGGFVKFVGVPHANGVLTVSRAIGDIAFKRLGVIDEPEVNGWLKLTSKDRYLIIASVGVIQCLSPEGVVRLLKKVEHQNPL